MSCLRQEKGQYQQDAKQKQSKRPGSKKQQLVPEREKERVDRSNVEGVARLRAELYSLTLVDPF